VRWPQFQSSSQTAAKQQQLVGIYYYCGGAAAMDEIWFYVLLLFALRWNFPSLAALSNAPLFFVVSFVPSHKTNI